MFRLLQDVCAQREVEDTIMNCIAEYVIVGGGIAGVTCAETLSALAPVDKVLLVTSSDLIKAVTNYQKLSRTLETFDVVEKASNFVESECPNVEVLKTVITGMNASKHELYRADGGTIRYRKLCICSGGSPKVIADKDNKHVIGIRDTESIKVLQEKLKGARRLLIVGNGGIATELVYEIKGCEIVWVIKDKSISSTFVDAGAAEFFLPHLNTEKADASEPVKRIKYTLDKQSDLQADEVSSPYGSALGPDWASSRKMAGKMEICHHVVVEYSVEVKSVVCWSEVQQAGWLVSEPFHKDGQQNTELKCKETVLSLLEPCENTGNSLDLCDYNYFLSTPVIPLINLWPVYVHLTNGKVYGCDFIVSATGVVPNSQPFVKDNLLKVAEDGGIEVNDHMESSVQDVYAAGDVCTAVWQHSQHWLQMRLWSHARQMGCYAAKCMVAATQGEEISLDFCFEMFAHVTKFFNFKVVLLGKFNAQGLGEDYEILLRITKGEEYVKVILQDGRMKGAILIGETDMEETFENLILNGMDLTPFKDHLLDSTIDIEDFFD